MPQVSFNSLMNDNTPTYSPAVAQPFRDDLTGAGFKELLTPEDVDAVLNRKDDKTVLVMLNSVCGCAARSARPGTILSMLNDRVPDEFTTVFAGMEKMAVNRLRQEWMPGLTPSSPNIMLFKNGELVFILQRYQIEGRSANEIARDLADAYDKECSKENTAEAQDNVKNYLSQRYQVKIEQLNL
jgi:putative YphP/YqiW family bacilliredoxin